MTELSPQKLKTKKRPLRSSLVFDVQEPEVWWGFELYLVECGLVHLILYNILYFYLRRQKSFSIHVRGKKSKEY